MQPRKAALLQERAAWAKTCTYESNMSLTAIEENCNLSYKRFGKVVIERGSKNGK